tara:strand:- start:16067 stop:16249 length:183 start_codon:yes stop_codon:yes gene_type:complete
MYIDIYLSILLFSLLALPTLILLLRKMLDLEIKKEIEIFFDEAKVPKILRKLIKFQIRLK